MTLLVVHGGISVKTAAGNVAPGCNEIGPGLAIPERAAGAYDFDALSACIRRVRGSNPDFQKEDTFTVTASPDVPFESLVAVIDAARTDPDGRPMFTNVQLGLTR